MITKHKIQTQLDYNTIANVPTVTEVADTAARDALTPIVMDVVKYPDDSTEIYDGTNWSTLSTYTSNLGLSGGMKVQPYLQGVTYPPNSLVHKDGKYYFTKVSSSFGLSNASWIEFVRPTQDIELGDKIQVNLGTVTITLAGQNPLTIANLADYVEAGAIATTADGNDVSSLITKITTYSDANTMIVTYSVDIGSCETTSIERTVNITNAVAGGAPTLTLIGDNPQVVNVNNSYTELGATASDTEDGDITANIVTDSSAVDTAVLGNYSVSYTITDTDSNTVTKTRQVKVIDSIAIVPESSNEFVYWQGSCPYNSGGGQAYIGLYLAFKLLGLGTRTVTEIKYTLGSESTMPIDVSNDNLWYESASSSTKGTGLVMCANTNMHQYNTIVIHITLSDGVTYTLTEQKGE